MVDFIPHIVAGMTSAELEEFKNWLRDCVGYDFDSMTGNQLQSCASSWYDEQAEIETVN